MKLMRIFATLIVAVMFITVISGCNSNKNQPEESTINNNTNDTTNNTAAKAFGRNNFSSPSLQGEVISVNGNEFELKIVEPQGFGGNGQRSPDNRSSDQQSAGERSRGQRDTEDKAQERGPIATRTPNYTGETKKITIPDGTPISKMQRGNRSQTPQPTATQVKIQDIKVGTMISIWYIENNQTKIERVSVR